MAAFSNWIQLVRKLCCTAFLARDSTGHPTQGYSWESQATCMALPAKVASPAAHAGISDADSVRAHLNRQARRLLAATRIIQPDNPVGRTGERRHHRRSAERALRERCSTYLRSNWTVASTDLRSFSIGGDARRQFCEFDAHRHCAYRNFDVWHHPSGSSSTNPSLPCCFRWPSSESPRSSHQ